MSITTLYFNATRILFLLRRYLPKGNAQTKQSRLQHKYPYGVGAITGSQSALIVTRFDPRIGF